ncbi:MAG: hypothetical protein Q9M36_14275 [Sulfurovum sp.]|nr:hypothetical protein [Sulfurovum sp.]
MLKFYYVFSLILLLSTATTLLYQKNTYAYHTLTQVDPLPHTQSLIKEEKYADAYEYLHYFMQFEYMHQDTQAHILLQHIADTRASFSYQSEKIAQGIRTGTSDELSGQLSAIGSDFFLIGDLRDLALEGTHYAKGEEVDKVLVSLSSIGLVATVTTLFTLGSTSVAKSAVSILKLAHKSQRMPLWLGSYLIKQSKKIKESKDISSLKPIFHHLETMRARIGLNNTLILLSQTKSFKALKNISALTKYYKKETHILLKLSSHTAQIHKQILKNTAIPTIKLASSYGASGFTHLLKGGGKHFIRTTQNIKSYTKIGYKGEIWKVILWLMKHLSDTVLLLIMGINTLLLLPFRPRKKSNK